MLNSKLAFGIDRILNEDNLKRKLLGKRIGFVGHPASVTAKLDHSLDALMALQDFGIKAAFGPQHGMRGEKQDNMMESEDYLDPVHKIPVYSLYGKVRRPTDSMLRGLDVILIDLQDVGCRIYTFLTTLLYILEECSKKGVAVWVLDRPNPAGRPVEGSLLEQGWESFVGAGPLPMRHGLTLGEASLWFKKHYKLDIDLNVVKILGYDPTQAPGFGWPVFDRSWVNPSPNAATLSMARCYAGTVMIEGTHLSEGRGTTRPLEMGGAPQLDMTEVTRLMKEMAPQWLKGCTIRTCYFEPTFHKHQGRLCNGMQIHVDDPSYDHTHFRPYRLIALWFKAIRSLYPNYELWRHFPYEYEQERLAIDLINGGSDLRLWVDNQSASVESFETRLARDEKFWIDDRKDCLLYP